MKKILILMTSIVVAFAASAQYDGYIHHFSLSLGGGMNTMSYDLSRGDRGVGMGMDLGFRYGYFFSDSSQFGIGVGLNFTTANAYACFNRTDVSRGLIHADNRGVSYDLSTTYSGWKERQSIGVLGIPIELLFRRPLTGDMSLLAGFGVMVDIGLYGRYYSKAGSYSTSGYFPVIGHYVENQPEHGFDTYNTTCDQKVEKLRSGISFMADIGVNKHFSNAWAVCVGIYGGYGLSDIVEHGGKSQLLTINQKDARDINYNGTFALDEVGTVHFVRLGIKIGISVGLKSGDRKGGGINPEISADKCDTSVNDSLQKEIDSIEKQINMVKGEISRLEKERDQNKKSADSISQEIKKLKNENRDMEQKDAEYKNDLRKKYTEGNIDSLYATANKEELNLHKKILGTNYPRMIDDLLILLECNEILNSEYNEEKNSEYLRKIENVAQCNAKDEIKYKLEYHQEITKQVKDVIRENETDQYSGRRNLFSFINSVMDGYGIDLPKDYPYLGRKIKECISKLSR